MEAILPFIDITYIHIELLKTGLFNSFCVVLVSVWDSKAWSSDDLEMKAQYSLSSVRQP